MRTWIDLTDRFPIKFDVERMKAEIAAVESADSWLSHYDVNLSTGWRAILLKSRKGDVSGPEAQRPSYDFSDFKRTVYVDRMPYFRELMDRMQCPQSRVRILRLSPGAGIGLHRDILAEAACLAFGQVRLHVPIVTNDKVTFFVGGERIKMQPGHLYYVNFAKKHYVRNDGAEARIHLVMDVKVNEWLEQYFPRVSLWEKFEYGFVRHTWPILWKLLWYWMKWSGWAWRTYEGSRAQRFVHRLKGRAV